MHNLFYSMQWIESLSNLIQKIFRSVPSLYLWNYFLNDFFFLMLTFLSLTLLGNCLTSFCQMLLFVIDHVSRDYEIPSIIFKASYNFKLCKIIRSFVSLVVKHFYFIISLHLYPNVFTSFITSRSSILSEVKFFIDSDSLLGDYFSSWFSVVAFCFSNAFPKGK